MEVNICIGGLSVDSGLKSTIISDNQHIKERDLVGILGFVCKLNLRIKFVQN